MTQLGQPFLEVVVDEIVNESVMGALVTSVSRPDGRKGDSIDFTKSVVPKGVQKTTRAQRKADEGQLERKKLVDVRDNLRLDVLHAKRVVAGPDFYSDNQDYDWKNQIAIPSAREIVEERELLITETITSTVEAVTVADVNPESAAELLAFFRGTVRGEINEARAPRSGRVLAVSSDIYSTLLGHSSFESAAHRGDTGQALAEATIGRVYGFTVVEDINLAAKKVLAFDAGAVFVGHSPLGASVAASESGTLEAVNGIAVGYHLGYDPNGLEGPEDNIITGLFMGAKVAAEDRVKHYLLGD